MFSAKRPVTKKKYKGYLYNIINIYNAKETSPDPELLKDRQQLTDKTAAKSFLRVAT